MATNIYTVHNNTSDYACAINCIRQNKGNLRSGKVNGFCYIGDTILAVKVLGQQALDEWFNSENVVKLYKRIYT